MKRFSLIFIALIQFCTLNTFSQTEKELELLETKQKLLETEMNLVKTKLNNLTSIHDSISLLKKEIKALHANINKNNTKYTYSKYSDSITVRPFNETWEYNFFRLFEGSIEIGYEKLINKKSAINIALFGTYADQNGIGQRYVEDYGYTDNNIMPNYNIYYDANKMYGAGVEIKWKHYLLADRNVYRYSNWKGLYVAPSLLYRTVIYEGDKRFHYYDQFESFTKLEDFTNTLHVGRLAFYFGNKNVISNVFSIDYYIGGSIRLSEYTKDDLGDYSNWTDIDYSGIMPTAGLKLGFVSNR